ncbi:UNVERIFIED_CONTAM: DNA polymerase kappa [Sesamum calycinum]|uniref:DNA polymerase kappa n=1 Tax=Sesamum calycinum TaxID=2727403 RepID=A0AAW2PPU3_9LAMI
MEQSEKSSTENDPARPWQSYNTVYTIAKAGMEGVDKEKVQRIVYEMSKGSKYFENEEKKETYMKQKIESMRAQLAKLTAVDISRYQKFADKRIVELEATRDLSRIWLHVDMAFYAAVETLSDPSLKGKPMAVGSMSMISTANYEARKFGVRAAMPGFIARKLCPKLIFVPTDFKKYTYYSDLTRQVFQRYDHNFLAASLDEAYLDITNFCNEKGMTGAEVAEELRESVHKETGLTCSAGVAPNRLLAKVCSDINKPDGQFVLPNERMAVMTFISSLPIRKIGGIGKVTENILKGIFGITTCEEMLQKSSFICALFSRTSADFFLSVGLGLGRTDTPQVTQRKSMSSERTFSPTEDEALLFQKLGAGAVWKNLFAVDLSQNLASDLKKEGLCGRTLTLKLKTSCFEVRTRAVTLPDNICSSEDILKHATKLLKAELPASLRLMGLRMSHFNEGKKGVASDPKQRTLSNFIATKDAVGRVSESNTDDDNTLSIGRETSFSSDAHAPCESFNFMDTHQMLFVDPTDKRHGQNEAETGGSFDLQIDDFRDNVDNHDVVRDAMDPPYPTGTGEVVVRDSSPGLLKETSLDGLGRVVSCTDEESASSLNPKEPFFWLNDYQCSVCGIELPPSFVEERQEHFDFHLAERLQDEESNNVNRVLKPRQRFTQKDEVSQSRQRKKQRASPSAVYPMTLIYQKNELRVLPIFSPEVKNATAESIQTSLGVMVLSANLLKSGEGLGADPKARVRKQKKTPADPEKTHNIVADPSPDTKPSKIK